MLINILKKRGGDAVILAHTEFLTVMQGGNYVLRRNRQHGSIMKVVNRKVTHTVEFSHNVETHKLRMLSEFNGFSN